MLRVTMRLREGEGIKENQFCERRTFKASNYLTNQTVKCSSNKHRVHLKTGQLKYLTNTKL